MFKPFMNLKLLQMSLAFLLATYIRLVRRTTRWQFEGLESFKSVQDSGLGFIVVVWHSRFMMTPAAWSKMQQKPHILISKSRDGDLVTYASQMLGAGVVRGSRQIKRQAKLKDKDKRGAGALREMIDVLNDGDCIVMTPDGPRGPRMHMGEGPLRLAKLSGAPVLALALSVSNNKVFNSWDRFMLPLPFGRGKIIFSGPVSVAKDASNADIETARKKLENMLNQASQKCDQEMGSETILPANNKPARKVKT
ncbi:MAG: lysophospholipid acyltransferase family protein [Robiginitomaculum sp.]|nr:lysophospholipid acyltransferase family protein [Robiginitomaculum sp.]